MRNRGFILMTVLAVALAAVLLLGPRLFPQQPPQDAEPERLLEAVFDRIGVTQWSEAVDWYAMQESGMLDEGSDANDMPVWVARNGRVHFHSIPLCGGMKSPVRMTLEDALAQGYVPCEVCWLYKEGLSEAESP